MKCDYAVCNSVRAVFAGVLFTHPVGWLEIFSRQPKPVITMRKESPLCQDLKKAENSNCSSSTGFGPTLTTMTKPFAGSPRLSLEPPTCVRVNDEVVFFVAFKLLPFSLSYLLTAKNISVFLLGSCQVLVLQWFAFSFRLSKVRSLIEWKLSSFYRICCKHPIIRNLNSFRSRCLVDVRVQGDHVVQYDVVFFPSDVRQ